MLLYNNYNNNLLLAELLFKSYGKDRNTTSGEYFTTVLYGSNSNIISTLPITLFLQEQSSGMTIVLLASTGVVEIARHILISVGMPAVSGVMPSEESGEESQKTSLCAVKGGLGESLISKTTTEQKTLHTQPDLSVSQH